MKHPKHKIAIIAGDGIGPEVIAQTLKVADALVKKYNLSITFAEFPFGADYYLSTGITIPETVFTQWPKEYSAILLGALGDPRIKSNEHAQDILMGFRSKLDLFINFRPVQLIDKRFCPLKHIKSESQVNFVVFRENTEDLYAGMGGTFKKNTYDEVAIENAIHTYKGVERIIRAAFAYAHNNKRSSVTMADKSNVMRYAGDLWQRLFRQIGDEYPWIRKNHMYIDALCMDILRNPWKYEVIVTSNMFGDILTDVAAVLQGGLGLAASVNFNNVATDEHGRTQTFLSNSQGTFMGLFEPVHGSAPDIAGQNKANPLASILSFHLLLLRLEYNEAANALYLAVANTLANGNVSPDLGGNCSTTEVGNFICSSISTNKGRKHLKFT